MAHIHQNKPSFRYFAEPFNRPAHNSSDPDRAAPKGTDSLNTCAESQEHIPHKTRLQPGSSPAHRQMGFRRDQEVHTGLTADATTTHHTDPDRGTHQTIGPRPNDEILQPILDHTQLLGHHTHTRDSRDMHRQQEMAFHLWMVLWHINLQEVLQQAPQNRCLKCFRYAEAQEVQELDLSESDVDAR